MPICQQLMYAGHLLHGQLREKLCPEGIHRGQGRILSILAQRGTLSQTEIAECFHRRGATVTHMIQRLEEQGLVERVPDPSDARARRVSLTPAGREVAGLVQETWDDLERRLAAVLSPEQAVLLAGLLGLLIDELATQPAELTEGDD